MTDEGGDFIALSFPTAASRKAVMRCNACLAFAPGASSCISSRNIVGLGCNTTTPEALTVGIGENVFRSSADAAGSMSP